MLTCEVDERRTLLAGVDDEHEEEAPSEGLVGPQDLVHLKSGSVDPVVECGLEID